MAYFDTPSVSRSEAVRAVQTVAGMLPVNDPVSKPSARYLQLEALRALPRALMGGTNTMRAAGRVYMPQHPAESVETFDLRLRSTVLYGAFEQTVNRQVGKLFMKALHLNDDVPKPIQTICENIDGQGRALTPFCFDAMKCALTDGIVYVFVDMPKLSMTNLAEQNIVGARPYWQMIEAKDVIGWRTGVGPDGQQRIEQMRIQENSLEDDGDFGEREVLRIRVLNIGGYEVYTYQSPDPAMPNMTKRWVRTEAGLMTLPYIPVFALYTNRVGYMEGAPALGSLAEMCQEHWVSSSEQRHALTMLRFAMLKVSGVSDTSGAITIGPDKVLMLPPGADANYIEHTGAGIDSGFKDLEAIEQRMQSAGMQVRVEQAGQVTATTTALDSLETNAALKAIAMALKDSLEYGLQITADWLKLPDGGTVTPYTDFAEEPPQGGVPELMALRSAREISQPTLWTELERRHILSDEFDPEVEKVLLADDTANDLQAMAAQAAVQASPKPPPGTPAGPLPPPKPKAGASK